MNFDTSLPKQFLKNIFVYSFNAVTKAVIDAIEIPLLCSPSFWYNVLKIG